VLVHKPTYLDCFRGVNRVSTNDRSPYNLEADIQKRTLSIMLLSACGQLGGLSIISTYSTCPSPGSE
jgi:hypothetical protein